MNDYRNNYRNDCRDSYHIFRNMAQTGRESRAHSTFDLQTESETKNTDKIKK